VWCFAGAGEIRRVAQAWGQVSVGWVIAHVLAICRQRSRFVRLLPAAEGFSQKVVLAHSDCRDQFDH